MENMMEAYVLLSVDDGTEIVEPTTYSEALQSQNKEHWIIA